MQKFKCKFVKIIDLVIQGNVKLSTNNIKKVRVQLSWITFDFNFVFSWLLFDRALKNGSLLRNLFMFFINCHEMTQLQSNVHFFARIFAKAFPRREGQRCLISGKRRG